MSVWSESQPAPHGPASALKAPGASHACLSGLEGELIVVRISIEPRLLERLLDALAHLEFPINPQIYHNAALVYVYRDGTRRSQPTTTVEFPAYGGRLPEVKAALVSSGFDPAALMTKALLDDIACDFDLEPAPADSPFEAVVWYRQADGILPKTRATGTQ